VIGAVLLELALEQLGDEFLDAEFGKGVAQPVGGALAAGV
jgi:hypothetical protein